MHDQRAAARRGLGGNKVGEARRWACWGGQAGGHVRGML
jgi:hypothetical protein